MSPKDRFGKVMKVALNRLQKAYKTLKIISERWIQWEIKWSNAGVMLRDAERCGSIMGQQIEPNLWMDQLYDSIPYGITCTTVQITAKGVYQWVLYN